jgi:hypothetical protein
VRHGDVQHLRSALEGSSDATRKLLLSETA